MLCPGEPGERWARALGTRRRERACRLGDQSEPDPPAQSVSASARETQGPPQTILTAAPPAARAPATQLQAAGARGLLRQGAELAAAARSGRGCGRRLWIRTAASLGLRWPASARVFQLPVPKVSRSRWVRAVFLGREETVRSQLCDIRLQSRADVCRCKFKNCHWPGAAQLFRSPPPPDIRTVATKELQTRLSMKTDLCPGLPLRWSGRCVPLRCCGPVFSPRG